MCGISGWVGANQGRRIVKDMAEALRHRGPDDCGEAHGEGWSLGFRRLSILDLSPLGHQPMRTGDGRFWIAFNGEIYNYVELRQELIRRGERFESGSDTEVLLRMLAIHGPDALSRLNGMFALAIVDTRTRSFLLARDRLGVKPLYLARHQGALLFASELKALLAVPGIERDVDRRAIAQYLSLGYLASETCVFAGFDKLKPGHYLLGSLDDPLSARQVRYWRLPRCHDNARREITHDEIDELIEILGDAVSIRLRSDVPVGVFLSGGIDSGIVASLAARRATQPLLALTVGFDDKSLDETELAQATASANGLEHRHLVQPAVRLEDIDQLSDIYDEPFGDPSALPTAQLCRVAREHATVFLSGDGGDEAFGGYRRYIECRRHQLLISATRLMGGGVRAIGSFLPPLSLGHHRLAKLGLPDMGAAAAFDDLPQDKAIWHAMHDDMQPLAAGADAPLWKRWARDRGASLTERQQRLDYDLYLPDDILVKTDRASMASSIEVRSPFLDWRLVEWAARLPRSTLLNTRQGKLPLRALAQKLLPERVQRGVKKGFGVPLDSWFRSRAGLALLSERLLSGQARGLGFWDVDRVEQLMEIHREGNGRDFGLVFWRLLMLEGWWRRYAASPSAGAALQAEPGAEFPGGTRWNRSGHLYSQPIEG